MAAGSRTLRQEIELPAACSPLRGEEQGNSHSAASVAVEVRVPPLLLWMPHAGTPDLSREIDEISSRNQVPTLDAASLQKLIRENELREEKKRQASATTSEGSTSYAYQSGDTVHGKLDASKIQQQEELTETGGFEDPTAGGAHRDPSAGQDKPLPSLQVWSSSTSRCVGEPHGDNVWRSARSDHTVSSQSGQS